MEDRFDAIVVGAGPAGITAARDLAAAGRSVVVLERGQYPGAKNVSGGILYRQPTESMVPGFEAEAPLERPIIEQKYLLLTDEDMIGLTYRTQQFARPPFNAYSVLRSPFDRWYATTAEAAGAEVYPEFTVTNLLWEDGQVVGISTGDPDGELLARCVVLADGANSLLSQKAALRPDLEPIEQALVAKELIALPPGVIEDRFALPPGMGTAYEIFGASTMGLLGYGFIYTNKESLSIGTGALLSDLIDTGYNVNDMLDRFKRHPAIAPLLAGGETIEYSAHLIPEGGYNRLGRVFGDGVVVVGDAAGFVNPLNREGANLAMLSGRLAAVAIGDALDRDDLSAVGLSRYRELLDDSIVLNDMKKIRNVTDFAHDRPYLLNEMPELLSDAMRAYLTVDGTPKAEKYGKIAKKLLAGVPKRRTLADVVNGWRLLAR